MNLFKMCVHILRIRVALQITQLKEQGSLSLHCLSLDEKQWQFLRIRPALTPRSFHLLPFFLQVCQFLLPGLIASKLLFVAS